MSCNAYSGSIAKSASSNDFRAGRLPMYTEHILYSSQLLEITFFIYNRGFHETVYFIYVYINVSNCLCDTWKAKYFVDKRPQCFKKVMIKSNTVSSHYLTLWLRWSPIITVLGHYTNQFDWQKLTDLKVNQWHLKYSISGKMRDKGPVGILKKKCPNTIWAFLNKKGVRRRKCWV